MNVRETQTKTQKTKAKELKTIYAQPVIINLLCQILKFLFTVAIGNEWRRTERICKLTLDFRT